MLLNKTVIQAATEALESDNGSVQSPLSVCFVCTGNTCRSPMAAAVLNHLSQGKYEASSAGISAFPGDEIAENAVLALKRAGIESTPKNDYEHHRSSKLTHFHIAHCDKIVAMTSNHLIQLLSAFPEYAEKITVMPKDIPDPLMGRETVYDLCLERITAGLKEIFGT